MTEDAARQLLVTWVRDYATQAGRDEPLSAFVAYVDGAILAEIPELEEDPVLTSELHASTRAQFQVFLSLLERESQELLLPPQAVDLALSIARRQLELAVLLKVYRIAAAAVWTFFTDVAAGVPEGGPDRTDILIYLWDHAGTWINEAIEQLIGVFYAEREATMHDTLARRIETVHALLRGDALAVNDAALVLEHPLRTKQTALIIWTEDSSATDAPTGLNQLASLAASHAHAALLTIPAGRGELWCWLSTAHDIDPRALVATLTDVAAAPGTRVAIGYSGAGLAGFRSSHREAADAQRFAASHLTQQCTFYGDVELQCLVASNEPGIEAFVARELGNLADPDPALDRVRTTLRTYLDTGANVEQTATALFVHKNTVRYRLSQAEELIGHPLSERRTEIGVALRCFPQHGSTAGRPGHAAGGAGD
ncbi:hypothetical protein F7P69_14450 [Cellulosimicrobium funkei]|nr:hypothetical protein [Cellulosimicrobium funkei]